MHGWSFPNGLKEECLGGGQFAGREVPTAYMMIKPVDRDGGSNKFQKSKKFGRADAVRTQGTAQLGCHRRM
ncbi:hypothetical protein GCM10023155_13990 [Bremerella cremea]